MCPSAIHDMPSHIVNTRSLAALTVTTQSVFFARSLRTGSFNLWSRHHWRMSLNLCTQAACSNEFITHVIFTCLGSTFSYSRKEYLIPRLFRTKLNRRQPAHMHSVAQRAPAPARIIPPRAGFYWAHVFSWFCLWTTLPIKFVEYIIYVLWTFNYFRISSC